MNSLELYTDILSFCTKNAEQLIVKKHSGYFNDGFNGFGLTFREDKKQI